MKSSGAVMRLTNPFLEQIEHLPPEFKDIIENKNGWVLAHWDGTAETEEQIKNETKATIRNIPLDSPLQALI